MIQSFFPLGGEIVSMAQGLLPFQLIQDTSQPLLISFAGLPLVMETFQALSLLQGVWRLGVRNGQRIYYVFRF